MISDNPLLGGAQGWVHIKSNHYLNSCLMLILDDDFITN